MGESQECIPRKAARGCPEWAQAFNNHAVDAIPIHVSYDVSNSVFVAAAVVAVCLLRTELAAEEQKASSKVSAAYQLVAQKTYIDI